MVLERIKSDHSRTTDCYTAMLIEWLKMINPQPTWEGLVQALLQPTVGCQDLALKIAREHDLFLQGKIERLYLCIVC